MSLTMQGKRHRPNSRLVSRFTTNVAKGEVAPPKRRHRAREATQSIPFVTKLRLAGSRRAPRDVVMRSSSAPNAANKQENGGDRRALSHFRSQTLTTACLRLRGEPSTIVDDAPIGNLPCFFLRDGFLGGLFSRSLLHCLLCCLSHFLSPSVLRCTRISSSTKKYEHNHLHC